MFEVIPQYDGNISITSVDDSDAIPVHDIENSTSLKQTIPVILNFRPVKKLQEARAPVRKTLKRDNKLIYAATLPKIACYHMRSLIPKINMLATDLEDRSCSLALLTEVWKNSKIKGISLNWKNF